MFCIFHVKSKITFKLAFLLNPVHLIVCINFLYTEMDDLVAIFSYATLYLSFCAILS